MRSSIDVNLFPPKEYRRKYMRELITGLRVLHGLSRKDAKMAATAMITLLEEKFAAGEPVDLGCVKLDPQPVKPRVVQSNLEGGRKHFLGESVRWRFLWRDRWLKERRPSWSRHF